MTESPVGHAQHVRGEMPLDQKLALDAAAARLEKEFADLVDRATIERLVTSAYDHFSKGAKVETFLPLLAERSARDHLKEMAEARG
ncbi:three-helix bundle dimerization domain-containing protein [Nocardia sp. NPDC127526]|uniref:three-helix bundle dimerization domain-containing protein n=1 Tax=Nocardia sp. NPDC127526 TaxID=3345393 RepID=UPI00363DAF30